MAKGRAFGGMSSGDGGKQPVMKSPSKTDWLAPADQQFWFDRHRPAQAKGLQFDHFQEFLGATLYPFFASFPRVAAKPMIPHRHHSATRDTSEQEEAAAADLRGQPQYSCGQERRLFEVFDVKRDRLLDRDEFGAMCSKWLHNIYQPACGLVIVDVQNDFIDGSMALSKGPAKQDGGQVVPVINDLIEHWQQLLRRRRRQPSSEATRSAIVYTQDWHPPDHIGFHANLHMRKYALKTDNARDHSNPNNNNNSDSNKGIGNQRGKTLKHKEPPATVGLFDTVLFDGGRMEQRLWPTHCVQNSWGAQLHPKLRQVSGAIRVQKGTLASVDAYSAFWDNMRLNETGLRQELAARQVQELFFCGLALDFCVSASALDAAKAGFITYVIEDACRGLDQLEIAARKGELLESGVFIVQSCHVRDYLMIQSRDDVAAAASAQGDSGEFSLDRDFIKTVAFRKATV